jgi:hypothetical protein
MTGDAGPRRRRPDVAQGRGGIASDRLHGPVIVAEVVVESRRGREHTGSEPDPREGDPGRPGVMRALAVLLASFVLGAATSWAQDLLPDALQSVANSPSGWTTLTAGCVALARPSLARGALLGAASFVLLVLGYTAASELRGLFYSPVLWTAVGLVAGPVVGGSAVALRSSRPPLVAVGSGLLAAVLLLDAGYGLTVVADTTSPVYWWLVGVLGVALLVFVGLRALRPARRTASLVALQLGTTIAAVAVGAIGFYLLNAIG